MKTIGTKINDLIKRNHQTFEEVGILLNVDKTTVFSWIKQKDVNTRILRSLSVIYSVSMSYFFDDYSLQISNVQTVSENGSAYNVQNANNDLALKDEKIKGLEREVELLKKMVSMLEK